MKGLGYQIHRSAIYREVGNEVVLIQAKTGCFYYFDKGTKQFLDLLKTPKTVCQIAECAGLGDSHDPEVEYLTSFCQLLLEKEIIERCDAAVVVSIEPFSYERPVLLREGQKKLDEVASDVAVLTVTTT